jgi:ribosomal-protein-alanine N-acetyltransferase
MSAAWSTRAATWVGRGYARKMLLHLMDRARAAGMYEAFLEVRPSNTVAARLYHSMGFEQVGIRRGYYQATVGREDAAVLRRILLPENK